MIRECKIHGLIEHRSRTEYGRNKGWICKKCNSEATTRSKRKRKADSVAYKGGKCEICGYDKCQDALEFHPNHLFRILVQQLFYQRTYHL